MINEIINGENVEETLINILNAIHEDGPVKSSDFEVLTYIKLNYNNLFSLYEKRLLYLAGLFYKVDKPQGFLEEIYDIYAQSIFEETGVKYTPMQSEAYRYITSKRYFSFSAPTSSGKSFLFRELIKDADGDIIIVLPSRALIAEYMAVVLSIADKSVLVLQFIENVNTDNIHRRIYIVTPERAVDLFEISNELDVRLILLDEAQISEEEVRGMKFDSFVRRVDRYLPNARKVFAHPFINNPEAQLEKHNFLTNSHSSTYNYNSVGKIFFAFEEGQFKYFSPYDNKWTEMNVVARGDLIEEKLTKGGTVLIYLSKKKIIDGDYITSFSKYIDICPKLQNPLAVELIEKLKKYIGANDNDKSSLLINMMEKGIVIHHGSIPLRGRLIIEEFVRKRFAKMCFATSTLNQGINMPFDVVWIDNFYRMDSLTLKNLIGRAGRSTLIANSFDYGYVVINSVNRDTFIERLNVDIKIKNVSLLDQKIESTSIDDRDVVEAMQTDAFNDDFKLTESQVERLNSVDIEADIKLILDKLLVDGIPLNAKQYYELSDTQRNKIKSAFKNIYIRHLRRDILTRPEASILSAAIPLLLWHIQGKSFSEVISLRYAYLSEKDKRREIESRVKNNSITASQAREELRRIPPKYSCKAGTLPNIHASNVNLFSDIKSVLDIDYDTLVYDTYDYLDKVISLSLASPLCAAFMLYADRTNDNRAIGMANYIRYGTNDETTIWLLKYGFTFEDIEWIIDYVEKVDSRKITFKDEVGSLEKTKREMIERYL